MSTTPDYGLLVNAAFRGYLAKVKELVGQGYDLNVEFDNGWVRRTPLDNAIENQEAEVVRYLLENGAEVNRTSEFGTPLHHAVDIELEYPNWLDEAANERPPVAEVTQILVEFGADVNAKDSDGATPLDNALLRGHVNAIKILEAYGAVPSKDYFRR